MPIPASWTLNEEHYGEQLDAATNNYKITASCFVYNEEAARFADYWANGMTPTSGGTMTVTEVVEGVWSYVTIVAYDTDPEDCHEDVVDDIKTMQDALAANDTQVTQANTAATGEIAVYSSGKITAVLGRP